jgi:hypothetical protein
VAVHQLLGWTKCFEFELAIENLKSYKPPGIDQIPAVLIKADGRNFAIRSIKLLFLFGKSINCLSIGRSRQLYVSIRRATKQIVVITGAYNFCQIQNFIQHPALKFNYIRRGNYW